MTYSYIFTSGVDKVPEDPVIQKFPWARCPLT